MSDGYLSVIIAFWVIGKFRAEISSYGRMDAASHRLCIFILQSAEFDFQLHDPSVLLCLFIFELFVTFHEALDHLNGFSVVGLQFL